MKGRLAKILLPILVLGVGLAAAVIMVRLRPQAETRVPESIAPLVRVRTVHFEDVRLSVHSQGSVAPRTQTTMAPQVRGKVVKISPSFVSGGFVKKGELLVELDPLDYELAVIKATATVAHSQVRVAREQAEARVAEREWQDLGDGEASPLARRELQLQEAQAEFDAAQASLRQAEANLARTRLHAPFDGRVRSKSVDVGQFVGVGQPLGVVYSIDVAEVRLPLPDGQLAYIDLPLVFREETPSDTPRNELPEVTLRTNFAGATHEWSGRVVRTEGEIDPRSRMVHVVVQVKDPYAASEEGGRPPLAIGMFVDAEIYGRTLTNVTKVPRAAIRNNNQVLVVDQQDRMHFRNVEIVRMQGEEAIIRHGIESGERICLSTLAIVTEGMQVRSIEADAELLHPNSIEAGDNNSPTPGAGAAR